MSGQSKKKPYTKPVIVTHGSVEKITRKAFGASDAMLFEGDPGGSSNAS
jgi:hypothetical protein